MKNEHPSLNVVTFYVICVAYSHIRRFFYKLLVHGMGGGRISDGIVAGDGGLNLPSLYAEV